VEGVFWSQDYLNGKVNDTVFHVSFSLFFVTNSRTLVSNVRRTIQRVLLLLALNASFLFPFFH